HVVLDRLACVVSGDAEVVRVENGDDARTGAAGPIDRDRHRPRADDDAHAAVPVYDGGGCLGGDAPDLRSGVDHPFTQPANVAGVGREARNTVGIDPGDVRGDQRIGGQSSVLGRDVELPQNVDDEAVE